MDKRTDISKMVEKALDSLNNIKKAEPQPFFYTRLRARLEREEKSWWETTGSFLAKPVTVIASLCLILVFNAFILFNQDSNTDQPITGQPQDTVTDNEYVLASNSSFDFENLDQQ